MAARMRTRRDTGGLSVRIRYGEGQDSWFDLNVDASAPDVAEDRRKRLQRLANLLKAAGKGAQSHGILEKIAAEKSERAFRLAEAAIEGFTPESVKASVGPRTFRQVAEYYSAGLFQDDYPDSVRKRKGKTSLELSAKRLEVYYPVLGSLTFDAITDELVEKAKKKIPKLDHNTRRAYLQELRRVLRIAARPLKLVPTALDIEVPPKGPRKSFTFLYPSNEYQLISSSRIPFERRFLYAWLGRNGERITEALLITWSHVNLKDGTVRVEADWTKTGVARFWDLDHDVLEALRLRHAALKPLATHRVFVSPLGRPMNRRSVLRWMVADLRKVGLDEERPELLEAGAGEQTLRVHDLGRGTFVTLARAMGRPDRWIMDRTGHDSVSSLELYDRVTRHAQSRNLGWLAPMGRALGMAGAVSTGPVWAEGKAFVVGHGLATALKSPVKVWMPPLSGNGSDASISSEKRQKDDDRVALEGTETPRGPDQNPHVVHGRGPDPQSHGPDPEVGPEEPSVARLRAETALILARIEESLTADIKVALAASRFELVEKLLAELGERRRARTAPTVASLDAARAKKRDQEGK